MSPVVVRTGWSSDSHNYGELTGCHRMILLASGWSTRTTCWGHPQGHRRPGRRATEFGSSLAFQVVSLYWLTLMSATSPVPKLARMAPSSGVKATLRSGSYNANRSSPAPTANQLNIPTISLPGRMLLLRLPHYVSLMSSLVSCNRRRIFASMMTVSAAIPAVVRSAVGECLIL